MRSNSQATLLELIPERKTSTLDVLREKIRILQTLEREHTQQSQQRRLPSYKAINQNDKTSRKHCPLATNNATNNNATLAEASG